MKIRKRKLRTIARLTTVTTLLWTMISIQNAHAATIPVTSTADDGSAGTLRVALATAVDGDTIDATGITGTINLTFGLITSELFVEASVTILGPGPANLSVDANHLNRVFTITPGHTVTIAGLTITNGFASSGSGGGILNDHSSLTVSNCVFQGNSASVLGGGIYNNGFGGSATVQIRASTLSGNSAGVGGGIYNDGRTGSATLEISASALSGNSADAGGGIFNAGSGGNATLTVSNCALSGNSTSGDGGGIYNGLGTAVVSASTFNGNSTDNNGGGIYHSGSTGSATLTVADSIFSNNSAGGVGGGIYHGHSPGTISHSIFSGNSAGLNGGGIYNDGAGSSGGVTLTVIASTVTGNSAFNAGGILNDASPGHATLTVIASTISGNSATATGGGIFNLGIAGTSTVQIANCTLTGNSGGGTNQGGIINNGLNGRATVIVANSTFSGNEGSIRNVATNSGTSVTIGSTILKSSSAGVNLSSSGGPITSQGFNLSSDDGGGFLTANGDQIDTDPLLGPLADNGGPTFTHLPLPGSPAIDQGTSDTLAAFGLTTDQRGEPRTVGDPGTPNAFLGDGTDIGAVELQQFELPNNPPVAKCKNVTVLAGPDGTASASIDDGSFDPDGDPITIVQTPPGPYPVGNTTVTLAVTDSHGLSNSCSATVTVVGVSDLLVSLAVDKPSVKQGEQLTYTITVHNFGPQEAANVVINDALSSGSIFVSAHANRGNFTTPPPNQTGVVTWNLGNLSNGEIEGAQLVVKVIVKGKTTITNTATASTDSADPNPANNVARITTTIASGVGGNGGKK